MDIKRKIPFYPSDLKDALDVQCIASVFFMYFACLTPIITFGGLLGAATHDNMVGIIHRILGPVSLRLVTIWDKSISIISQWRGECDQSQNVTVSFQSHLKVVPTRRLTMGAGLLSTIPKCDRS